MLRTPRSKRTGAGRFLQFDVRGGRAVVAAYGAGTRSIRIPFQLDEFRLVQMVFGGQLVALALSRERVGGDEVLRVHAVVTVVGRRMVLGVQIGLIARTESGIAVGERFTLGRACNNENTRFVFIGKSAHRV